MVINKDKMVAIIYELRESNSEGKILETVVEEKPLTFIYGTGRLLPVFETHIKSLKEGESFSFNLGREEAYGEKREEMIFDIPISVFEVNGEIDIQLCMVGNEVPMVDSSGNRLNGIVNEITDTIVKMDFNHPMAGIDLFFKGKIISVREATEKELSAAKNSCSWCGSVLHTVRPKCL
jgi:FKBP-type peptidyl-prolyl cis-trans isomerase SlyD